MRRYFASLAITAIAVLACGGPALSCVGTTGGALVSFSAYASGPRGLDPTKPYEFDNPFGFHVSLSRAKLHVGSIYLNGSPPTSGAQATGCVLPGIYVGEVLNGFDVDVLSPAPQPFAAAGDGTSDHASVGELWLTGAAIDASDDPTTIVDVAGTAAKGSTVYAFSAQFHLGSNWYQPPSSDITPGANPICKQRIVTPIPIDIVPTDGGALYLEIDPKAWFANVDFTQVPASPSDPNTVVFTDSISDSESHALFVGVHGASAAVYKFSWQGK